MEFDERINRYSCHEYSPLRLGQCLKFDGIFSSWCGCVNMIALNVLGKEEGKKREIKEKERKGVKGIEEFVMIDA